MSKPDEQTAQTTEPPTNVEEPAKDDNKPEDAEQATEPATEEPKDESPAEKVEDEGSKEGSDELPEWAREKMTEANAEAANYRVKLREAEEKLKTAKTPDEVEAVVSEATTTLRNENRDLLIENIALKHKLPAKLQSRLVGNTREELEADAQELAADFGRGEDEVRLEGGLRPRGGRSTKNLSPGELAAQYGSRKRR